MNSEVHEQPEQNPSMMAAAQVTRTMQAPTRLRNDSEKRQATETLEKDATELRLEKALFGDDEGFLESLTRPVAEDDRALLRFGKGEGGDSDHGGDVEGEEQDFGDVADDDVSSHLYPNA